MCVLHISPSEDPCSKVGNGSMYVVVSMKGEAELGTEEIVRARCCGVELWRSTVVRSELFSSERVDHTVNNARRLTATSRGVCSRVVLGRVRRVGLCAYAFAEGEAHGRRLGLCTTLPADMNDNNVGRRCQKQVHIIEHDGRERDRLHRTGFSSSETTMCYAKQAKHTTL